MRHLSRRAGSLALAGILIGAMGVASTPLHAQQAPNLVGTWKGMAQSVHLGTNPYRPSEGAGPVFSSDAIEFTFTIAEQKDNRFSGKSTDGKRSETFVGAISPNNQTGVIIDNDGQYLFAIRDPNTIDACYSHLHPTSKVVSCYTWKRGP